MHHARWRNLRAGKLASLLPLSVNPYMLAMLIDVYDKGEGKLPQNRAQLFADFAAVLFSCEPKRRQESGAH